jgi:hypothetical protein
MISFPFVYKRSMKYSITKMLENGQNKGTIGSHSITITDHELRETTEVSDSRWTWSGVERVEQTTDYIFIFISPVMAHIIPKRAFESPDTAAMFYTTALAFFNQAKNLSAPSTA